MVVEGHPWIRVTGRAAHATPKAGTFDVLLVIDTSGSTATAASVAERFNGRLPLGPLLGRLDVAGPSILEAEITAAKRFLAVANRATTRVGVVTFAQDVAGFGTGGARSGANAWVEHPLTSDYDALHVALDRVKARGPHGGTDMVAGVRLAIRELHGIQGAVSRSSADARKVILLLTDGFPSLPFGGGRAIDERNVAVTLDAVRVAARSAIVMHTFCLGPEALSAPVVCHEAARLTGGTYHPVQRPADIVDILPTTAIGQVGLVTVRNATTGQLARSLSIDASGRFAGEVPLAPGANRLVAELHGEDAAQHGVVLVHYRPERAENVQIEVQRPAPEQELELKIERAEPGRQ
jgi:Mg-chelatase subunit ChlD